MSAPSRPLLVFTTLPDRASAEGLAMTLVEQGLAACASVQAPCLSIYRWQGAIEQASEVPLLIKSSSERYAALQAAILAAHPYQVPEIIALPISHALPAYLAWLATETS